MQPPRTSVTQGRRLRKRATWASLPVSAPAGPLLPLPQPLPLRLRLPLLDMPLTVVLPLPPSPACGSSAHSTGSGDGIMGLGTPPARPLPLCCASGEAGEGCCSCSSSRISACPRCCSCCSRCGRCSLPAVPAGLPSPSPACGEAAPASGCSRKAAAKCPGIRGQASPRNLSGLAGGAARGSGASARQCPPSSPAVAGGPAAALVEAALLRRPSCCGLSWNWSSDSRKPCSWDEKSQSGETTGVPLWAAATSLGAAQSTGGSATTAAVRPTTKAPL